MTSTQDPSEIENPEQERQEVVVENLDVFEHQDVELPEGSIIDLRFSGMLPSNNNYSTFAQSRDRIVLLCNERGLPDRYLFGGRTELLAGETALLMRKYMDFDPVDIENPEERRIEVARRVFESEDSFWVTTNPRNGRTNAQKVVKPKTADSVEQIVMDSKALTKR